ncbi:hypothetical protein P3H15_51230 [Rhodococcus sp. T2V]|uniref:hypothetical protein n=1 Tax=Rhodococcus sp. T2V TaxID=3034164 RepID=UPI0023E2EC7C|nr:hypothetical protein [Rhodococcus sp. T2V]MDF3313294.1 hypothetical protein [Rhodococcus sp. T2V]
MSVTRQTQGASDGGRPASYALLDRGGETGIVPVVPESAVSEAAAIITSDASAGSISGVLAGWITNFGISSA